MGEVSSLAGGKEDSMVQLSVPGRFYPAVLQYLGELYKREADAQDVPGSEPAARVPDEQDPNRGWSRDGVRRLKSMVTNPTVLAVFDLARGRDDRLVSIRELEQHTGRRYEQVRADFGGLTRTCRTRLDKEHWPFYAVWAADGKPQMSYQVPDDVLLWWHED